MCPRHETVATTLLILASMMLAASLSGCNTVEGVGKDVKAVGRTLAEAARDVRD